MKDAVDADHLILVAVVQVSIPVVIIRGQPVYEAPAVPEHIRDLRVLYQLLYMIPVPFDRELRMTGQVEYEEPGICRGNEVRGGSVYRTCMRFQLPDKKIIEAGKALYGSFYLGNVYIIVVDEFRDLACAFGAFHIPAVQLGDAPSYQYCPGEQLAEGCTVQYFKSPGLIGVFGFNITGLSVI